MPLVAMVAMHSTEASVTSAQGAFVTVKLHQPDLPLAFVPSGVMSLLL